MLLSRASMSFLRMQVIAAAETGAHKLALDGKVDEAHVRQNCSHYRALGQN